MKQPAETAFPVHELIAQRWSPRAFATDPLTPEQLGSLLEAARWAPSSFNEQPWDLIFARREDTEAHARLAACLVEANRLWAASAPLLLVTVAKLAFERNGKPNRHAWHDVGLATMSLVLQAEALGLAAHQMAGFDPEAARRELQIPEGHEPVTFIAIGRRGDPSTLPAELAEHESAPRVRRPLAEISHAGRFGRPWTTGGAA